MSFIILDGCAIRVILLVSFCGEFALAQWRCSALDTNNNKYYLPDFGGTTQVLGYTWEQSLNGVTYVYEVDNVGCSGTVTAVQFCYTLPPSPTNNEVFTLLALTQQSSGRIRVTNSIPIRFDSRSAECSSSKCCDIMTLREQDQFNLPSSNFFLGMTTTNSPNLAAPFFGVYPRFQTHSSYQVVAGQPTVNSILTLISAQVQTLRLVWLHINRFSVTTTSSIEQSTSSVLPKTTVSPTDDTTTPSDTHSSEPLSISSDRSSAPDTTTSSDMTSDVTTSHIMTTAKQPTTLTQGTVLNNVSTNNEVFSNTPTSLPISTSLLTEATFPLFFLNLEGGSSASSSNTSAVSAVIGVVVVLIVTIIIVLLVLVMFILYRRKKYHVCGARSCARLYCGALAGSTVN